MKAERLSPLHGVPPGTSATPLVPAVLCFFLPLSMTLTCDTVMGM